MSQQSLNVNIPSIQNQKPVNFQQNIPPAMQGIDQERVRQTARETADNNYITNRAKASKDTNPLALLGLGTVLWYGIGQMMEKINPLFGGKYEDSLGGKIGAFGDKISDTWLGKKVGKFLDWTGRGLDKVEKKSRIVYSLRHHSTSPEWSFAKMPGKGLEGFLAADAEQVVENFVKPIEGKVERLGFAMNAKDVAKFSDSIKGLTPEAQKLAIQTKELELLGADAKVIEKIKASQGLKGMQKFAKALKVRALDYDNIKDFDYLIKNEKFIDNPARTIKRFEKIAKAHPDWKIPIWKSLGGASANPVVRAFHKVRAHLFGREVGFSEYYNKYLIATGQGAKSRLGKALTKSVGWLFEGGTNRFAGGKLAVAMQAGIFADMLLHTYNAPKGEKVKTLAERLVNDFSYFVALTLGIMGMHKVGGFKYAGLRSERAVKAYDKARLAFNKKADAGFFKSKAEYNVAYTKLKAMLGTKNIKNPITKLLQKIGSFINIGNQRVHSYKSNAKYNLNWLRKIANGNIIGVPMRILIPLAVITPVIVNFTTKTAHKIFGRPTNSVLDEDEEEPKQAQQQSAPTPVQQAQQAAIAQAVARTQAQQQMTNPAQNPTNVGHQPQYKNPNEYQSDTNLIKKTLGNSPVFTGSSAQVQQNQPEQVQQPPTQEIVRTAQSHPTIAEYQQYPNTNYVKQTLNGQYPPQNGRYIPSPDSVFDKNGNVINNNTTVINSVNGDNTKSEPEPKRTYIPSPECKVTDNTDMTAAEKALADADNAEKFINDTLSQMK